MRKHHINEFVKTGFANKGRAAGIGISEDDYGDNSFADHSADGVRPYRRRNVRLQQKREEIEDGPVTTYFLNKGSEYEEENNDSISCQKR